MSLETASKLQAARMIVSQREAEIMKLDKYADLSSYIYNKDSLFETNNYIQHLGGRLRKLKKNVETSKTSDYLMAGKTLSEANNYIRHLERELTKSKNLLVYMAKLLDSHKIKY
jgi:hypothetical protein